MLIPDLSRTIYKYWHLDTLREQRNRVSPFNIMSSQQLFIILRGHI